MNPVRSFSVAFFCLAAGISVATVAWAAPKVESSLPEPLTLQSALALADAGYPDVVAAEADLEGARAARDSVQAGNGLQLSLQGRLRWVEPYPQSPNQTHDDNHIGLFLTKRLYDFGRSESRLNAAKEDIKSRALLYTDVRTQHRLDIMAAYFDVLLADLRYARDNEAMAVAYVAFDRTRDRRKQGEISDIEVLKAQAEYQQVRRRRYASDVQRRATRARLAILLNHPGSLPSTLVPPDLPGLRVKLSNVEVLQNEALAGNPAIQALRASLQAATQRVQAARAGGRPIIDGEIDRSEYSRVLGSSDRLRAGIVFSMPLYTSGYVSAEVARQQAVLRRVRAQLAKKEMQVRQAVLDAWQEVYVLRAQRDAARANSDYRDLYVDRSRALYEMDVKTDLGDSMVEFTAAQLQTAQAKYQLALTLARLNALAGKPLLERADKAPAVK